jgi:hypothetical protein
MLKWLVIALLAANAAFFAWTQGWLDGVVGMRALGDREPGRLAQQVKPDSVVILTPKAVAAATSTASAATSAASAASVSAFSATSASSSSGATVGAACLEAGPFTSPELTAAEAALTGLVPAGTWSRVPVDVPGIWVVYMGPYPSADMRSKKEAEVRRRGLRFEAFKLPLELSAEQRKALTSQLVPGLSLGRYASLNAADAALADFGVSGIHSARVVEVLKPYAAQSLRVAKAEPALAARLTGLTGNAANNGPLSKPFVACSST